MSPAALGFVPMYGKAGAIVISRRPLVWSATIPVPAGTSFFAQFATAKPCGRITVLPTATSIGDASSAGGGQPLITPEANASPKSSENTRRPNDRNGGL